MIQMQRPLEVTCPAIPLFLGQPALQPVSLSGTEGLDSLFRYELLLQTLDGMSRHAAGVADWSLDTFVGAEIQCRIQLDGSGRFESGAVGAAVDHIGAGVRQINAIVSRIELAADDARDLQYRLTLRPWLHLATLNSDCRVFQDLTVVEILDEILAAYPFEVHKRLIVSYPKRDFQVQFNESDFAFFSRLTQEYGIHYGFEHAGGRHRLVLADHIAAYAAGPKDKPRACDRIDYRPAGWKADAEYFHRFVPARELAGNRYSTTDHDYRQPASDLRRSSSEPAPARPADPRAYQPARPLLDTYQWHHRLGGSQFAQPAAGDSDPAANSAYDEGSVLALLRLEALTSHAPRATASGNLRGIVAGRVFRLANHPLRSAECDYLVLDTRFVIENPAYDSQRRPVPGTIRKIDAADKADKGQWRVHVDLTAYPMSQPLRPALTQPKPQADGLHTALVVGPPGANVWTDELGRIKLQFPWDRVGRKNERSSCWVRVLDHWAGCQMGQVHIPRIGQEVQVAFTSGDPDLPVCVGSTHNPQNAPPWMLPSQLALSGIRSRELGHDRDGQGTGNHAWGRGNHIVLDDTEGAIQAQIKSDHQHSQLSLGAICRIEDHQGRKDMRGDGFDLRTDGHGVVRAGAGVLISTENRQAARGHAKDMPETVHRLHRAQEQHTVLGRSARQGTAQVAGEQEAVAIQLKGQNRDIQGQGEPSGELTRPHVVIASAAGIASTSAGPTHIASEEAIALTSRADTSISAFGHLLASAREAIRLFAFRAGMKLVAAAGDIEISALQHSIKLLAQLDIRMEGDRIELRGRKEVVINGGGSYLRLDAAGVTLGTAGTWNVRAGRHGTTPEHSVPVETTLLPRVALRLGDAADGSVSLSN